MPRKHKLLFALAAVLLVLGAAGLGRDKKNRREARETLRSTLCASVCQEKGSNSWNTFRVKLGWGPGWYECLCGNGFSVKVP